MNSLPLLFIFLVTLWGSDGEFDITKSFAGLSGQACLELVAIQVAADPDLTQGIPSCELDLGEL